MGMHEMRVCVCECVCVWGGGGGEDKMLFFESKGAPICRKALKLEFKMLWATLLFSFRCQ